MQRKLDFAGMRAKVDRLRLRLAELDREISAVDRLVGRDGFGVVARLLFELHGSVRWGRDGSPSWAEFLRVEGLRVEDLEPRLDDSAVREFACALVDAGLSQAAAACVLGLAQRTVSRYVIAAAGRSVREAPRAGAVAVSDREFRETVVAAEVGLAGPEEPADLLILAGTAVADASRFVDGFVGGMGTGSSLGLKDERLERLLRGLSRDLELLVGKLPATVLNSGECA